MRVTSDSPDGVWFDEGWGAEPDIHVVDHPTELARGTDPQLAAAVTEALRLLEERPVVAPRERPAGLTWGNT